MPSAFSHAVAAAGLAACFYHPGVPKRVWVLGALCAALPDLDVIGFRFGIRYGDLLGHRGLTHSLPAAAVLAALVAAAFPRGTPGLGRGALWLFFFLATASHGLLDACTDGIPDPCVIAVVSSEEGRHAAMFPTIVFGQLLLLPPKPTPAVP